MGSQQSTGLHADLLDGRDQRQLNPESMRDSNEREIDTDEDTVWVRDFAESWDACMVFPDQEAQGTEHRLGEYCNMLYELGFELFAYREQGSEGKVFVLIRIPLGLLTSYADTNNLKMLADEAVLERMARAGDPEHNIAPIDIAHMPSVIQYRPYQYVYLKYSQRVDQSLYFKEEGDPSPFSRDVIRLKLLALIMESRPHTGGENLKLKRYVKYSRILGIFPLHDAAKRQELKHLWFLSFSWPWRAPFNQIKDYFGEKFGLFIVFQGHYNRFLLIPALLGVPVQIAVFLWNSKDPYEGFSDAPFLPFYSFFVSIWAIFMLEFWKRRENRTAMEWGMIDTEDQVLQPEFRGERIRSYIDGRKDFVHFPTSTRNTFIFQSSLAIVGLSSVVVGVVASLYTLKQYLVQYGVEPGKAQTYASIVNSVLIQVTNFLFSFVADELTKRENHRTQSGHDDSLVVKIFSLQFINSFTSFFYLAFLSEVLTASPNCGEHGCMYSLSLNLITIFAIRLISQQAVQLVMPWIAFRYKLAGGAFASFVLGQQKKRRSRPELEFLLTPYDSHSSFIDDMMDATIQFGFVSLFITSFPGAAALALCSNMLGLKGKAWKMLNIHQRPTPVALENIGTFQSLLLITAICAVITNAALVVFTMNVLNMYSTEFRMWIFVGFQWVCFALQAITMEAIPDEPEAIQLHKQRIAFLESKIVDRVEDDPALTNHGLGRDIQLSEYPVNDGGFFQKKTAASAPAGTGAKDVAFAIPQAADLAASPSSFLKAASINVESSEKDDNDDIPAASPLHQLQTQSEADRRL